MIRWPSTTGPTKRTTTPAGFVTMIPWRPARSATPKMGPGGGVDHSSKRRCTRCRAGRAARVAIGGCRPRRSAPAATTASASPAAPMTPVAGSATCRPRKPPSPGAPLQAKSPPAPAGGENRTGPDPAPGPELEPRDLPPGGAPGDGYDQGPGEPLPAVRVQPQKASGGDAEGNQGQYPAAYFHRDPGTICQACHHHSPPAKEPPRCSNCHNAESLQAREANRPALLRRLTPAVHGLPRGHAPGEARRHGLQRVS